MDRRLVIASATLVAVLGCERRVAEPTPTPASSASAAASAAATAPSASASADPLAGRCIKPLPAEPERRVPKGPDPSCPDDPGRPTLPRGKVAFDEAGATVDVEIAKDPAHRQRGLMYRTELAEDEGMIFLFDRRRRQSFWMKNTCLPLDMIFIDRDGVVVGIQENVPTMNMNTYHVGCPSQYVLEVNAGWSRRHGVEPGDEARFVGFEG